MHALTMGNPKVPSPVTDAATGEVTGYDYPEQPDGEGVTTVELPEDWSTMEAFQTLTLAGGIVSTHFDDDHPPTWVTCADRPGLAELVAEHYGCEVRS